MIIVFYLTRPLLLREVIRKSSPVPFFTLKEGAPPLSPKSPFPSGDRGLKAWPAGPVLANKRMPLKGLLVVIDAIELRLFYGTESRLFDARCEIFYARYASVLRTMCEC